MNRETKRNIVVLLFQIIAILFHSLCSILTNFRQVKITPLPDVGLELFPYIPEMFIFLQIFTTIQMIIFFGILFFRTDRMIIFRRFMILFALLLFLRPLFFLGTQVSNSSERMICDYRLKIDVEKDGYLRAAKMIFLKALENVFNFRLISRFDHREDCYEHYMSMQTILTLLVYNFILKYVVGDSDRKKADESDSLKMIIMKSLYWFVTAIASGGGLFAQMNYSMDVVLAFFITNQIFAMYHTMCFPGIDYRERVQTNPLDVHSNEMQNLWWWPLFEYVELNDS